VEYDRRSPGRSPIITQIEIRHRARQTKGSGSRRAILAMRFKLGFECEKSWRRPKPR